MDMTMESCRTFVEVLASNAPAPGGGGAAALVGAIGTALGNMVGSLTVGKKKYADVEAEIIALKAKCDALQTELLNQVEADDKGRVRRWLRRSMLQGRFAGRFPQRVHQHQEPEKPGSRRGDERQGKRYAHQVLRPGRRNLQHRQGRIWSVILAFSQKIQILI